MTKRLHIARAPKDFTLPVDAVTTATGTFGIRGSGKTNTNVVMVEAEPAAFEDMQRVVRRDLAALIYRPRLEDGNTVPTDNLRYTHKFFYRQSDLADAQQEADVAATH